MSSAIAARGSYFGEGPRWHDGRPWCSDFFGHAVHALAPDGRDEIVLRIDGPPSGPGWVANAVWRACPEAQARGPAEPQ